MTIDEAIKHCEEVTAENEDKARWKLTPTWQDECKQRAAEHRQLAKWLKELKQLRKRATVVKSLCYSCHFYNQGYCDKDEIVIGENKACTSYISHSSVLADEFVADICDKLKQ